MQRLMMGAALLCLAACAQDSPVVSQPAPERSDATAPVVETPTRTALFGDLHIHTANSFDAFIFGTRSSPDDAYAFGQGATIDNGAGVGIRLSGPPLDFMAVTDHGEYLGVVPAMADRGSPLSKTETAKSIFGLLATDRRANFLRVGQTVVSGEPIADIYDRDHIDSVWAATVDSAQAHNRPGEFTTFAGYEYTAMVQVVSAVAAANLHRNVIFRDGAPDRLFSTLDSSNPEDLWDWMDGQREQGRDVLSIPHNSNASNGMMFASTAYDGGALTVAHAAQRLRNEPVVEITQVKGTSETHPALSPNDEWAGFELYDNLIGAPLSSDPVPGSFVREAIARGFSLPGNPYRVGVIGSSDTHVAGGAFSEEDFFGKFPHDMDNAARRSVPSDRDAGWGAEPERGDDLISTPQYGASGLAGVWATSNTREAVFDAMARRETFGTSGPRITVRLFMGAYGASDLIAPDRLDRAYAKGVPMGSEAADAGTLMVEAAADPLSQPLERLQIIALRADGTEAIYDVACAGGAPIAPATHRCELDEARVDPVSCDSQGPGVGTLSALWDDPDARPAEPVAYYARVLERPGCRWSSWDAARAGTEPSPTTARTVQDRAWSSPIWVGTR